VLIGGGIHGFLIFLFPPLFGEGYSTLRSMLSGQPENLLNDSICSMFVDGSEFLSIFFLALVLAFKAVATSPTTSAGGIDGVFAPSLFLEVALPVLFLPGSSIPPTG